MSIANRIPGAQALLARSRRVLEPHRAGRSTVLLDSAGAAPPKPATARDGAAPPTFVQRHGGH